VPTQYLKLQAMLPQLPITAIFPDLRKAMQDAKSVVLEAPPGAGKTTLVPLALLDEPWLQDRKILMLEPRRVAARAAASRMASLLGEEPGGIVGYRVRQDSRVSARTKIIVLTEALLTRRLQEDPELGDIGLVIFDEFHERSLNADLGLALALQVQEALNADIRLLVMSATLDGARISTLLGDAPVIRSEGRMFPVETRYVTPPPNQRVDQIVTGTILDALHDTEGGILAFLPGEGEIRSVERTLAGHDLGNAELAPLYGNLPPEVQDKAIRPRTDGRRKIVLATSIAETSLTIEDVRVVIDSGLQRLARYNPATGMTQLVTQRVSLASADQRRGRAGRVAPGICYRLWSEPETRSLSAYTPPEILTSDLAPLALEIAAWGERDASDLHLLDQPPKGTFSEAQLLLRELEALDSDNRITPHGRACLSFGAHPRLAHMMIRGNELGLGATAAALAAVLSERDITRARDTDLRTRLETFAGRPDPHTDRGALARAREQARTWSRNLKGPRTEVEPSAAGRLTALAYPERVARRRGPASFRLANGRGAIMTESDPLASEPFIAIAALDGAGANARVHQAAPLSMAEIEDLFSDQITTLEKVEWSDRERIVVAREETRLFDLVLAERPLRKPSPDQLATATLHGIRSLGMKCLPWTDEVEALRHRLAFMRRIEPDYGWPDVSDEGLLQTLDTWLAGFLDGISRATEFHRIRLQDALGAMLDWEKRKRLDAQAPVSIEVPSGSSIRIDYATEEPFLAVRLQEMFGLADTPAIANGRVPLLLHLLSPARRPVQVTRDLRSFWKNGYPEVKRDLKGRYPKHHWPDDPWTAIPTARAKPRGT
jgi:ATP-dependent helicase HrpB